MTESSVHRPAPVRTVLIVEDDDALRDAMVQLFSMSRWSVAWAANGREALAIFRADAAALIISDIIMPDLDGIELVRGIREFDNHTPIIILTGFGSFDNCLAALRAGASDFREKPFVNQDLLDAAERLIDSVPPAGGTTLASFTTASATLRLGYDDLCVPHRAAAIVEYIVGSAIVGGLQRRQWALTRALAIYLDALVARAEAEPGSGASESLVIRVGVDSMGIRVNIVSPWRNLPWEHPPQELPDPATTPAERDRFLLHTFCDEFQSGSPEDGATLVFYRPRPERPLRQGA